MSYATPDPRAPVAYARLRYRFLAMAIDMVLIIGAFIFGGFALALTGSIALMVVGFAVMCVGAILYEPLLVSSRGATIGHAFLGLEVLTGRGERLSFAQALARALLKGSIGVASFLWMAMTMRHQALHDVATRSTVRVVDPGANPERAVLRERTEPVGRGISAGRRILTTTAYEAAAFAAYAIPSAGLMSEDCVSQAQCGAGELLWSTFGYWAWLAVAGFMRYIQKRSLQPFAIYRVALGGAVLVHWWLRR